MVAWTSSQQEHYKILCVLDMTFFLAFFCGVFIKTAIRENSLENVDGGCRSQDVDLNFARMYSLISQGCFGTLRSPQYSIKVATLDIPQMSPKNDNILACTLTLNILRHEEGSLWNLSRCSNYLLMVPAQAIFVIFHMRDCCRSH